MAQIVIEFGAPSLRPILDAMLSVIGTPSAIEMEPVLGNGEVCSATKEAIDDLSRRFATAQIRSVTFRTESESVRYGLILAPHCWGQDLSMWMGTVELTDEDWRQCWDVLLRHDSLAFVCAGNEEGVELTDDQLTIASFPWDEWPMLAAALRTEGDDRGWVTRERTTARE